MEFSLTPGCLAPRQWHLVTRPQPFSLSTYCVSGTEHLVMPSSRVPVSIMLSSPEPARKPEHGEDQLPVSRSQNWVLTSCFSNSDISSLFEGTLKGLCKEGIRRQLYFGEKSFLNHACCFHSMHFCGLLQDSLHNEPDYNWWIETWGRRNLTI